MNRMSLRLPATAALVAITVFASDSQGRDVPYVPTPSAVVQTMLQMTRVGPDDIVYDLGSGDGRIVISAVRDFNARRAVGIDIDPNRIRESRQNAEAAGVSDRTEFIEQDVFKADFSDATVLTMYLLPSVNLRLRPRILSELKPGTRVVSHQFSMRDWEPDRKVKVGSRDVYMWIVPAKVEGTWRWTMNGEQYRIKLSQRHQDISGAVHVGDGSTPAPVENAALVGDRLQFTARTAQDGRPVDMRFLGRVAGDRISGTFTVGGQTARVEAMRREQAAARD